MTTSRIIWTKTDEAPALATYALLPVIQKFTEGTGIEADLADISLAGRIIANFPEKLTEYQKVPDYLTRLGELAKTNEANIIKLPNISASIPQLQAAIKELHLSSKLRSRSCTKRVTTSPSIPKSRRTTPKGHCRNDSPYYSARRSIRYFVKATPIDERPSRLRRTEESAQDDAAVAGKRVQGARRSHARQGFLLERKLHHDRKGV
jgi:hypothetical protein